MPCQLFLKRAYVKKLLSYQISAVLRHAKNCADPVEMIREKISRDCFQSQGSGYHESGALCIAAAAEFLFQILPFSGRTFPRQLIIEKWTLFCE